MKKARISLHPRFQIGEISPRMYGAFLEPIGTLVNGSMYNPKHPTADDMGFRQDYAQALKETGLPAVRLPGGNFVSGWNWKDSIGPRSQRKSSLDTAWFQYYTNDVGHDEYLQWTKMIGAEPLYTINLGTNGIKDALEILEYTNHASGSYWADLRRQYGHEEPYSVKTWYLGNEMDGPWQIGSWQKDPKGYGVLAHEVSKGMKWIDPKIETVACVSSSPFLAHYPEWDREVLQECYETVDYVSLHHYHIAPPGDIGALLGGSVHFEDYIRTEIALCDFIQTKLRTPKRMMLSFDEFGSRYQEIAGSLPGRGTVWEHRFDPEREYQHHDPSNMKSPSQFAQRGGMLDALTSASTFLTLLNHADRIKIGCMTWGLHSLVAVDGEKVWRPISYYPYSQLMRWGQGVALKTVVDCECYDVPGYAVHHHFQYSDKTDIPFVQSVAAFNRSASELTVFVINKDWEHGTMLEMDVSAFQGCNLKEHLQLSTPDLSLINTFEDPDRVLPRANTDTSFKDGHLHAKIDKLSWNVFRFHVDKL